MDNISSELLLEVLETLTKFRKDFPYTMLMYTMDFNSLMKTLDIFQGSTITFPSKEELLDLVRFTMARKYPSYEAVPKEVLGGLTKRKFNELTQRLQESD